MLPHIDATLKEVLLLQSRGGALIYGAATAIEIPLMHRGQNLPSFHATSFAVGLPLGRLNHLNRLNQEGNGPTLKFVEFFLLLLTHV